ncbi:hypothetical protein BT96DRAFT_927319 [Gymnopus androsaceus JB14]|uniref:Uncharacterized protein n=1 Tax=Gymnopus androsaceus JB14 TaxID=1447944 RepID=A0A6A4GQQ0_9AGAR|nr:hypothetical protein BT96DRAFT_927319 [Gymnopus androsaceus JB14]
MLSKSANDLYTFSSTSRFWNWSTTDLRQSIPTTFCRQCIREPAGRDHVDEHGVIERGAAECNRKTAQFRKERRIERVSSAAEWEFDRLEMKWGVIGVSFSVRAESPTLRLRRERKFRRAIMRSISEIITPLIDNVVKLHVDLDKNASKALPDQLRFPGSTGS